MPVKASKNGFQATCPACGSQIRLRKQPKRGQFVTCHDCDSILEVTRLSPLRLEWAFDEAIDDGRQRSGYYVENSRGAYSEGPDEDYE
jgi:lysine biosynthesis protein LysW